MDVKPNYYAIIPANVRYDRDLPANAKLLYGELTALSNEKGYCWAGNSYFAELYGVSKETVSRWISFLQGKGYVKISIIYKDGTKEIINRYVYINQEGVDEKINTPIDKKIKDNNTSLINNTSNIYTIDFESFWSEYPVAGRQNSKLQSFKNFKSLLKKKVEPNSLIQAAKNYATDCKTLGKVEYLYKASNFIGQAEYYKSYLDEVWEPAQQELFTNKPKLNKREQQLDELGRMMSEYDRCNSNKITNDVFCQLP